ncbi:MFS transporter [Yokenella regensburgei]|uniref:MFS transporter n=1 Tax=Yokenella regensburgei TaxID=158877 RepID=UPI003F160D85
MYKYKLSVFEKIGFGSGDMAINLVFSSMMLIITFFYTDVFGIRSEDLALLFIVVRLLDAVTDPLMGLLTEKFSTKNGRYRPYILYFSVPFGISIYLAFSTPDLDYNAKLMYAYASYIFVTLMFTAITIPYISLISVLTDDPKERLSANGYRLFFAKAAAFMVSIVVPQLAAYLGKNDIQSGYQYAMGLMGLLGTLFLLFCYFSTKERIHHGGEDIPVKDQVRTLFKNEQWIILCLACIFVSVGSVLRGTVAAYYAKYNMGGDASTVSYFLTVGVCAFICSVIISTWLTKKYCKIKVFRYSQIATFIISVLFFALAGTGSNLLSYALFFLLSFCSTLYAPIFWASIPDTIDYGFHKTGKRVSGLTFGGIAFCQKFGMGIAGALVGFLFTNFGYVPNAIQSSNSILGITLMLTIIPGVFHLLTGLVMFRYIINDKYYRSMDVENFSPTAKKVSEA